jgi:glycosyltransferase 2 family protein
LDWRSSRSSLTSRWGGSDTGCRRPPVPGGVGVTEAALTAGYVAVGVPEEIAFSAALCYRLCTFYLPPIWGYLAMNSLQKDGYL